MRYVGLLARLLYDPAGAISALRAERPVGQAFLAAVPATIGYELVLSGIVQDLWGIVRAGGLNYGAARIVISHVYAIPGLLVPLIYIVAVYVPASLFFLGLLVRGSGPADLLRRDYATSLGVALSVWTVTLAIWLVPALVLGDPAYPANLLVWSVLPSVTFVVPMVVNLARVAGAGYARAAIAALLAATSLLLLPLAAWAAVLLSSPLFVIIGFFILRGVFREWSSARNARERLERSLAAATLNPADASAHVNLGIIYKERGEVDRAAEHFRRALEIDPDETDARYHLGRIARERRSLGEAIAHFDAVVQADGEYQNSEVWREIGATYFAAGQYADARAAFEHFTARRPSDAEGLYLLGLTHDALGQSEEARACMQAVVDAVRTAPIYKYRLERRWLVEAESFLRNR